MKKYGIEFHSDSNRDYEAFYVYSDKHQLLNDLLYGDLQYLALNDDIFYEVFTFDDDDPFWKALSCE